MPPNFQAPRHREERCGGGIPHSLVQAAIIAYLWARRERWGILVLPELALAGGMLPVPDIGVIKGETTTETAPFLCIEITSPQDDVTELDRRIEEYLQFGASFVWVIDPVARVASIHSTDAGVLVPDGWLRAEEIEVPLAEIFA